MLRSSPATQNSGDEQHDQHSSCDLSDHGIGQPEDALRSNAHGCELDVLPVKHAGLGIFFATMSLGVWYVFRKRGRIYI